MDLLSMVMDAQIQNVDGDVIGQVEGIAIHGNKMTLIIDELLDDEDGDDPDGGEEVDVEKIPVPLLRAVGGPANG